MFALIFWIAPYIYICMIPEIFREVFAALIASMHTLSGLSAPHGPCIIDQETVSQSKGSSSLFGVSAEITQSTTVASRSLSSCTVNRLCV